MQILNFGSCNIDYVYHVAHSVRPGETISAQKLDIFPGGKGLNQSIAAACAGANIWHAGCIGREGAILEDTLRQSGVNVLLEKVDAQNGHAIIQISPNGENCIVLHRGTNGMLRREWIDQILEKFSSGNILILQNEVNLVPYIIEMGHKKGMEIILNAAPYDESLQTLDLNLIHYLVVNEIEASGFFGTADADAIRQLLAEQYPNLTVVLTLGKAGCRCIQKNEILCQAAYPVTAVDTTAAGDTFTGFFAAGLAGGLPIQQVLRNASAAAALAVTRLGAAPSIPSMQEVISFLKAAKE